MERENPAFFNSPVIQKNTPLKRLGLSRKRKGYGSECNLNAKIQACSEKFPGSPIRSEKFLLDKQIQNATKYSEKKGNHSSINYDVEIDMLKKRIYEKEEELKSLQYNKNKIVELEGLIELWRNGCKNALLHFTQLLKDQQSENIDLKTVLNKLGIWKTIMENFENDSEISLLDFSQYGKSV